MLSNETENLPKSNRIIGMLKIQNDSERFKKVKNDALLFIIARFDSKQLAVNERFPILP